MLMPMIMLFCVVGAFAINNTPFDIGVMVIAGVVAFVLEENGVPIAPAILGVVLGGMLEDNFVTSMIKADGNLLAFFDRPVAATLGAMTLAVWFLPHPDAPAAAPRRRLSDAPAAARRLPRPGLTPGSRGSACCPPLPHCGIISRFCSPILRDRT